MRIDDIPGWLWRPILFLSPPTVLYACLPPEGQEFLLFFALIILSILAAFLGLACMLLAVKGDPTSPSSQPQQ